MNLQLRTIARAVLLRSIILTVATCIAAGTAVAGQDSSEWKLRAKIYGWLPSIDGETIFRGDDAPEGEVDISKILESIDAVFMGGIEITKGRWGLASDYIYIDLNNEKTGPLSLDLGLPGNIGNLGYSAGLSVTGWSWTTIGTYALVNESSHNLQLVGGFRYLDLEEELRLKFVAGGESRPVESSPVNLKAKDGILDAIIGVRGRYGVGGSNWYIPYYLDLGTGESDFTWQAASGIGYAFDHFDLSMTYRQLEWEFSSSKVMQSLSFRGPVFGIGYRW